MESESFCNDCQGKRRNIVEIVQTAKKIKIKFLFIMLTKDIYACNFGLHVLTTK